MFVHDLRFPAAVLMRLSVIRPCPAEARRNGIVPKARLTIILFLVRVRVSFEYTQTGLDTLTINGLRQSFELAHTVDVGRTATVYRFRVWLSDFQGRWGYGAILLHGALWADQSL